MEQSIVTGMQIDKYEIIREISRGGMGVVYQALDRSLNRSVAIKVILAQKHPNNTLLQRFLREAQICAQLSHPNIIRIYDSGVYEQNPYIVMEYITGIPLLEYVRQHPNDWQLYAKLMLEMTNALIYIHQKKIIHRDIKSSNILVRPDGTAVLIDFGIARITQDKNWNLTLSQDIIGSLTMSPEQAKGHGKYVDARSDIYSLGATFYEVITNHPIVEANSTGELLRAICEDTPVFPKIYNKEIPNALSEIILRCLEKKPANRYKSAIFLKKQLNLFLEDKTKQSLYLQRYRLKEILRKFQYKIIASVFLCFVLIGSCFYFFKSAQVHQFDHSSFLFSMLQLKNATNISINKLQNDLQNQTHQNCKMLWNALAESYTQTKNYEKALTYYKKIRNLAPYDFVNYENLKKIYDKINKDEEYLSFLNDYIKLQQWDWNLYDIRATIYQKKHDFKTALKDYSFCLNLYPDDFRPYFNMLQCLVEETMVKNYQRVYQIFDADIDELLGKKLDCPDILQLVPFCKKYLQHYYINQSKTEWNNDFFDRFYYYFLQTNLPIDYWVRWIQPIAEYEEFLQCIQKVQKELSKTNSQKSQELWKIYYHSQLARYRHLLARYIANDISILKLVYNEGITTWQGIKYLLENDSNEKFSFFAAKLLQAIDEPETKQMLHEVEAKNLGKKSIYAWICSDTKSIESFNNLKCFDNAYDEFTTTLLVQYMPDSLLEKYFDKLIKNPSVLVQLWIAKRYLSYDSKKHNLENMKKCFNILLENEKSREENIQLFVAYTCETSIKEYRDYFRKNYSNIIKKWLFHEADSMRIIALTFLSQPNEDPELFSLIQKILSAKNLSVIVRIHALYNLSRYCASPKKYDILLPIVYNTKENLFMRSLASFLVTSKTNKISLQKQKKVFDILRKENNKSFYLMIGYHTKNLPKDYQSIIHAYYKNDKTSPYIKVGILLSMSSELSKEYLSFVKYCLKDIDSEVRCAAAFIYVLIMGKNNFANLPSPKQFKELLQSLKVPATYYSSLLYGASLGYIDLLYKEFERPALWEIQNFEQNNIESCYNYYKEQPLVSSTPNHKGVKALEEALLCINYSIELNAERPESYLARYLLKSLIANKKQAKEKEHLIQEAVSDMEKAYTLNQDSELFLKYLAYAYLESNHPKAKETFNKAFFNNPFDKALRTWKKQYKIY